MDGGRDVGVEESKSVAAADRRRLVGETKIVERPKEPVAGTITGKDSSRAVAAVRGGGQTDDQKPRADRAEARNRAAPIVPFTEPPNLFRRNPLSIFHEPRTTPAIDNFILGRQLGHSG